MRRKRASVYADHSLPHDLFNGALPARSIRTPAYLDYIAVNRYNDSIGGGYYDDTAAIGGARHHEISSIQG